jgi:hypothetical protein
VIQVIFRRPAFEQMNQIIQANPTRTAEFATALQELTAALASKPDAAGESREPPYRVLVCGQLTFRFRPAPDEGRAYVVRVRLRQPRS